MCPRFGMRVSAALSDRLTDACESSLWYVLNNEVLSSLSCAPTGVPASCDWLRAERCPCEPFEVCEVARWRAAWSWRGWSLAVSWEPRWASEEEEPLLLARFKREAMGEGPLGVRASWRGGRTGAADESKEGRCLCEGEEGPLFEPDEANEFLRAMLICGCARCQLGS